MQLSKVGLSNKEIWEEKNFILPNFDLDKIKNKTKENPIWIHFGAGNIFRAFHGNLFQKLLDKNKVDKGLIVVEGYDYEIIEKINKPYDDLSILVTLKSNGEIEKKVIGSIVESLTLDRDNTLDFNRLKQIFINKSLQVVSFTITEKGYNPYDNKGQVLEYIEVDLKNGPDKTISYLGKIASLIYERYKSGMLPISMVSMDNCSSNGYKLYEAIKIFADNWVKNKFVDSEFLNYINNESLVAFPWTMIDKITPRPDKKIEETLKKDGLENISPIITEKNTYIASFINAEESEYLVIEDLFPNGRPNGLEELGVIFTDRETVKKAEKMKVCTCLNPLHTTLAVFGCLLGYKLISEEVKDSILNKLINNIGYIEGIPVVEDPKILNPKEFLSDVINIRLTNPFIPDTPQRIATDTSQKIAIRFGKTIKEYEKSKSLNVDDLKFIPLVLAGWLRYCMGIDDEGNKFTLSPDPLMDFIKPIISKFKIGKEELNIEEMLSPILSREDIFGVNLYKNNLSKKIIKYFEEMIASKGAVYSTLKKYVESEA